MTKETSLFSEDEWLSIVKHLAFAPRQEQTVRCLLDGLTDKQIAAKLGIAESTVRSYLQRLYAKHNVQDRTALVVYVFRQFRMHTAESVDRMTASD